MIVSFVSFRGKLAISFSLSLYDLSLLYFLENFTFRELLMKSN